MCTSYSVSLKKLRGIFCDAEWSHRTWLFLSWCRCFVTLLKATKKAAVLSDVKIAFSLLFCHLCLNLHFVLLSHFSLPVVAFPANTCCIVWFYDSLFLNDLDMFIREQNIRKDENVSCNKVLNLASSFYYKRPLCNSLLDYLPLLECMWGIFIGITINSQLFFITF